MRYEKLVFTKAPVKPCALIRMNHVFGIWDSNITEQFIP